MTDIVERLRTMDRAVADGGLYREAAAEIERLRAALAYYADPENDVSIDSGAKARRALEPKP